MERAQLHLLLDTLLDLRTGRLDAAVPPAARQHFQTAKREVLLGVRAVVENALQRMEQEGAGAPPAGAPNGGVRSIPVTDD